jgi:tetratricopeptide (TPR) repeat protein
MNLKVNIFFAVFLFAAVPLFAGYYEDGIRAYNKKNYDDAKVQFEKAVEVFPNNGNAYFYLGEIERNLGNFEKAIEFYRLAVENNAAKKYYKMSYWNLTIITEQMGNYNELVKLCKTFWRRAGDKGMKTKAETLINKSIWSDNADAVEKYNKGMKRKTDNAEEAMKHFREAIAADSRFLAPKFELGLWHYREGRVSEATSYFSEIVSRVPFYGDVHLLLGNMYYNEGYYARAADHLTGAIDYSLVGGDTEYELYLKRGTSYFKIGEFDRAKKDMLIAVKMKPNDLEPLFILSAINIKQEQYDDALKSLASLEKKKPNDPALLFQIGSIYYRKNDERHIRYFDRLFSALSASEDKAPEGYRKAMEILARHHYEKSNLAHAKEIIDFIPGEHLDATMRLISARTAYGLKDYEGAIAHYEKISIGSEDSAFLAAAYLKTGKIERARELVHRYYHDEKFISLALNHRGLKSIIEGIEKDRADSQKQMDEQQKKENSSEIK